MSEVREITIEELEKLTIEEDKKPKFLEEHQVDWALLELARTKQIRAFIDKDGEILFQYAGDNE